MLMSFGLFLREGTKVGDKVLYFLLRHLVLERKHDLTAGFVGSSIADGCANVLIGQFLLKGGIGKILQLKDLSHCRITGAISAVALPAMFHPGIFPCPSVGNQWKGCEEAEHKESSHYAIVPNWNSTVNFFTQFPVLHFTRS